MPCRAEAIVGDATAVGAGLRHFLEHFPEDSPYYNIRLGQSGKPVPEDVDRAASVTVMVEARCNAKRAAPHGRGA